MFSGEKLKAIAISVEGETETLHRTQGLYLIKGNEPLGSKSSIPTAQLIDRPIQAIAVGENRIYAGTQSGLYWRDKNDDAPIWKKVENTPFGNLSVQAINIPSWDSTHIYVGTSEGLFKSEDSAKNWSTLESTMFGALSIISVVSLEDTPGGGHGASTPTDENSKYIYVAIRSTSEQDEPGTGATVYRQLQNSDRGWEPLPYEQSPLSLYACSWR